MQDLRIRAGRVVWTAGGDSRQQEGLGRAFEVQQVPTYVMSVQDGRTLGVQLRVYLLAREFLHRRQASCRRRRMQGLRMWRPCWQDRVSWTLQESST